jgi:hypothetical protein
LAGPEVFVLFCFVLSWFCSVIEFEQLLEKMVSKFHSPTICHTAHPGSNIYVSLNEPGRQFGVAMMAVGGKW